MSNTHSHSHTDYTVFLDIKVNQINSNLNSKIWICKQNKFIKKEFSFVWLFVYLLRVMNENTENACKIKMLYAYMIETYTNFVI